MHARIRSAAVVATAVVLGAAGASAGAVASAATPTPTRTVLSTGTPSIGVGSPATLKAVVKPVGATGNPNGNVTLKEGATVVATVPLALVGTAMTAKFTVNGLAVGTHQFTATYAGNATWASSTSLPVSVVVTKPQTTTKIKATPTAYLIGQVVHLSAVVKQVTGTVQPTGSVTFTEGGNTVGGGPVALVLSPTTHLMTAKLNLSGVGLGSHTYSAAYGGSASFNGSTAPTPVTITVAKGQTTTTITNATATAPNNHRFNVKVAPVAPATGVPTGNVTITVSGFAPQVFALSNLGAAHISLFLVSGTTYTVTATYGGDAKFGPSNATIQFTMP